MMPADAALHADSVHSGYGEARILNGVTVTVERGSFVTVIGPNGSGKSTLLKTIVGLVRHTAGTTMVRARDGSPTDITRRPPYALGAIGLSYVPQIANVFVDMTVLENLQLGGMSVPGGTTGFKRRLDEVLQYFPSLRSRLGTRAGTLSGGQRQMVAMARALISDPVILLLDEPSAGLQPNLVDEVFGTIRRFSQNGLSILMVEQKARQALEFSDYAYVLEMGRNRYEGAGAILAADPTVIDLYLGAGRLPDLPEQAELSTPQ